MNFKYDKESGCAYIGDTNKKVKYSIGVANTFIIDLDFSDNIIGIEIIEAEEVLKDFKININKIKNVGMKFKKTNNYFAVTLIFKQEGIEKEMLLPVASAVSC